MRVVVTGGAGFIGSAVVRALFARPDVTIVNIDKLTYAADLGAVTEALTSPRYHLEQADVADFPAMHRALERHQPDAVIHLAAESHVDRSIDGPAEFVRTNLVGTFALLEAARTYWEQLDPDRRARFRFVHVSTDEVFGALGDSGCFDEHTPYRPRSPYSASKAGADHLARAWAHTYGLPVIVTNCSNNYGPHQFPEKLIPLTVQRALEGRELPVYGRGEQVRDWLYVDDHAAGLLLALERGHPGETYLFGGRSERRNIDVVRTICEILDELEPNPRIGRRESLIRFVTDRAAHDWRYSVDPSKAERELGWRATESFATGLRRTVAWYIAHGHWRDGEQGYRGERLGLGASAQSSLTPEQA